MKNNNKSKGKIHPIEWSPIAPNTHFLKHLFENQTQWCEFKRGNAAVIQTGWITLTPVVDQDGNLFNPVSPFVLFLN